MPDHPSEPRRSHVDLADAMIAALDRRDLEFAAALHALAAPFLHGRVERHIDLERRGIDFPGLLKASWSTTERAMIEIACTLWGREDIADARLSPVLYSMDAGNFQRVVEAMRIRRGPA